MNRGNHYTDRPAAPYSYRYSPDYRTARSPPPSAYDRSGRRPYTPPNPPMASVDYRPSADDYQPHYRSPPRGYRPRSPSPHHHHRLPPPSDRFDVEHYDRVRREFRYC